MTVNEDPEFPNDPIGESLDEPKEEPIDRAFAAYLRSCDAGEMASRDDFLKQFPDVAQQLSELMEVADLVGRASGVATSPLHPRNKPRPSAIDPSAKTVGLSVASEDDSNVDPGATLPMPYRAKGDHGPTLPFNLGDYELLEMLGKGGMGIVYLARQTDLDRLVAVKMIRGGMLADESDVRRFYTEAQAAAKLNHPGIVPVHHFGQRAGHHFFSMSYIRGVDLQRRIDSGVIEPKTAARYVRDVARAIDHAHHNGVLHRDLKPANVMIDTDDNVLVTDFGLAKRMDSDSSVTGTGKAVGTPHYMAPEQAGGYSDLATQHSDIYSMGAILFACLTGRPPIMADNVVQTLLQVIHDPAPSIRSLKPDTPLDLDTIVAKCLEKLPTDRYQTATELANDLDAFINDQPIAAKARSLPMKVWHWLEGVPLVAAVTGRRMVDTSLSQRRFQAAMLLLLMISPFLVLAMASGWREYTSWIPREIAIAGGVEEGIYDDVSATLAERMIQRHDLTASMIPSNGSLDNRDRLLRREVDLAPMQASAVSGDTICVVAPLFYEKIHLLVASDSDIQSPADLANRRIAVGPLGSGSRATAEMVFESLGLPPSVLEREESSWSDLTHNLNRDNAPQAVIISIGVGSSFVFELLASERFRLLPIEPAMEISLQHPTLRPMTIDPTDYPGIDLPESGIATVGTTAFLAARHDSPDDLVTAVLESLYQEPEFCSGLIPRKNAAEWQGLSLHRAARQFYNASQSKTSPD
ncbi:Serine/threonine-protein kinase PrkC [Novipirellula aureliae]|uniref:non-specific serine/threonine protein kinase n=1 Tax=Novipirellula aureliae TaxID=2527966 RepID=A0A5C6E3A6_9BACT|nr:serine/threonine-protein kinase [Novipirellula aureliae]TWU43362.1 Serine/threonine-protein kinase PrkC [Novipirellula aureliae]